MSSDPRGGGNVSVLVLKARKATGLNQSDLAERAHVSRSSIIAAEACTSVPSMEVCVKLARALSIPLDEMLRAHAQDSLHSVEPEALSEVEGRLGGGKSHWEEIAEHHGLWIEHARVFGKVNERGDLELVRRYRGCHATRSRDRIVFRDRVFGERAPGFAIKGSPKGLGFNMNVTIEGDWAQHRVEFHRPWSPEDGPFDLEFESVLPHCYVLDLEEYNRRRTTEGHSPTREWHGDFRTFISYSFETLELKLLFPKSYEPKWCAPTAVWGNAPIDDADYHEVHRRTCLSDSFSPGKNEARLVLKRPAPGYTLGIRWIPVEWQPDAEEHAK